ncbi:hypothetical protein [Ferruginivarius sediminum]|uniref:hypothetical protein n=1 Tax=Ferruginivarius sediminum TaxID=2661937 RepID=UPI0012933CCF|nr:hypothetical protein [Ferruginivarius sediminum]
MTDLDSDKTRPASAEIEITPEMAEAGVDALLAVWKSGVEIDAKTVVSFFLL